MKSADARTRFGLKRRSKPRGLVAPSKCLRQSGGPNRALALLVAAQTGAGLLPGD